MAKAEATLRRLRCVECDTVSDEEARGWKAYIGGGYENEPTEVGTFCPLCAEREFGPSPPTPSRLDGDRAPFD